MRRYHLKRRREERGSQSPFSEVEARFYCASIALGLEALHKARVVYRDLKPDNLLLTPSGAVKLTDLVRPAPDTRPAHA